MPSTARDTVRSSLFSPFQSSRAAVFDFLIKLEFGTEYQAESLKT